jgi:C4-type Zn-finger protein
MQLKLKMECPLCGSENGLKVYEYNENHVKQVAEISGQCINCPVEYNFKVKGVNTEKLRELVYTEE